MSLRNLLVLLFLVTVHARYSRSDRCYSFLYDRVDSMFIPNVLYSVTVVYQLFVNKDGTPHSFDYIIYTDVDTEPSHTIISRYCIIVLCSYTTTCNPRENDTMTCRGVCESVYYKIWDTEANSEFIDHCGTDFNGEYRDIT